MIFSSGLLGVSIQTMRVFVLIALSKSLRIGQIDIGEIEIGRATPDLVEQSKRAAVKIVADDDVRTAVEQLKHGRHRGEAGRKGKTARAAFQDRRCIFRKRAGSD